MKHFASTTSNRNGRESLINDHNSKRAQVKFLRKIQFIVQTIVPKEVLSLQILKHIPKIPFSKSEQ